MRKARKIINILKGQKPLKKRRKSKKSLKHLPFFLLLLFLGLGIFFLGKGVLGKFKVPSFSSLPYISYDVTFSPLSDKRLTDSDLKTITQIVTSHMNNSHKRDFNLLAKKIQNQFTAQQVNISQTDEAKITLTMSLRDPVLLIKADKIRYVDKDCFVYGEYRIGDANSELPTLHGIFSDQDNHLKLTDTATYLVTNEQQGLICDAIGLLNTSREKGMEFSEVHFVKYRGFMAKTKSGGIEVLLGYAPFNKRIDRLTEILLNLKKEGVLATRIELDYDNKAFVKEKSSDIQRSL